MDVTQPTATAMTMEAPQQTTTKQEDEQVKRLRGGGAFADCLAYRHPG